MRANEVALDLSDERQVGLRLIKGKRRCVRFSMLKHFSMFVELMTGLQFLKLRLLQPANVMSSSASMIFSSWHV